MNQLGTFLTEEEARALIPGNPSGPTLWRWRTRGVAGCRLEAVRAGGRRLFYTPEGIARFLAATSAADFARHAPPQIVAAAR